MISENSTHRKNHSFSQKKESIATQRISIAENLIRKSLSLQNKA